MSEVVKRREPVNVGEDSSVQDGDSDASASPRLVINTTPTTPAPAPMALTVPLTSQLSLLRNGGASPRQVLQSMPALGGRYVPLQPHQLQQFHLQQQQQQQQQQIVASPQPTAHTPQLLSAPAKLQRSSPGVSATSAVPLDISRSEHNSAEYIVNCVPGTDNRVLLSSGRYATIDPSLMGPINALMAVANQRPLPTPAAEAPAPSQAPPPPASPPPPVKEEPAKKKRRRKPSAKLSAEMGMEKAPRGGGSPRPAGAGKKAAAEKVARSRPESAHVLEGLAKKVRRKSVDLQAGEKPMPTLVKEGDSVQPLAV